jgi:site-specific recombinase XerC
MWAPDMGTFVGISDAAMLSLLMGCGLRVSGLTALNVSDSADAAGGVHGPSLMHAV